jgi:hypothetical protein
LRDAVYEFAQNRWFALESSIAISPPAAVIALVEDLCKDASWDEIDTYVKQSGRNRIDAWMTKLTFRHVLLKRAYTKGEFMRMAGKGRFSSSEINVGLIGFEVRFVKPARTTVAVMCFEPAWT